MFQSFPEDILTPLKNRFFYQFSIILLLFLLGAGCTSKPNQQELDRLENARKAAEAAEAQLEQLRQDRLELEKKLIEQKKLMEQKQKEVNEAKSDLPEKKQ